MYKIPPPEKNLLKWSQRKTDVAIFPFLLLLKWHLLKLWKLFVEKYHLCSSPSYGQLSQKAWILAFFRLKELVHKTIKPTWIKKGKQKEKSLAQKDGKEEGREEGKKEGEATNYRMGMFSHGDAVTF